MASRTLALFTVLVLLSAGQRAVDGRCVSSDQEKAIGIGKDVEAISTSLGETGSGVDKCEEVELVAEAVAEAITDSVASIFTSATAIVSADCGEEDAVDYRSADQTHYVQAIAQAYYVSLRRAQKELTKWEIRRFVREVEKDVAKVTQEAVVAASEDGRKSVPESVGEAVTEAIAKAFTKALKKAYC